MQNYLHFICPTDNLEPVINTRFRNRNYYYTSLGNSIVFDNDIIWQIQDLINKNMINGIYFHLSTNNSIVLDGLGKQSFSEIVGLNHFYSELAKQRQVLIKSWQNGDSLSFILSYYLNKKIEELQQQVNRLFKNEIHINGKIYSTNKRCFEDIHSSLICMKGGKLN